LEDPIESLKAEASMSDNKIQLPLTSRIDDAQNIIKTREVKLRTVIEHVQQSYCIT
jgi:hypothetical protein